MDGRNGGVGEDFRGCAIYFRADPSPATRAALAYCGADKIVEVRCAECGCAECASEPMKALDPAAQLLSTKLPIQQLMVQV